MKLDLDIGTLTDEHPAAAPNRPVLVLPDGRWRGPMDRMPAREPMFAPLAELAQDAVLSSLGRLHRGPGESLDGASPTLGCVDTGHCLDDGYAWPLGSTREEHPTLPVGVCVRHSPLCEWARRFDQLSGPYDIPEDIGG